jgi:hypothetical protein
MKKRLSVVSKTAAAVSALGIGLLLLISCSNIFAPPQEGNAGGNGETGAALVSFGNGVDGARTLLPSGVTFARYDLAIEAVAPNTATTVTQTISSGSSVTVALTPGNWKIHVDAYTDAGGTKKAAQGDSETFEVKSNTTTPVSVALAAVSDTGTGTLSVDITGEDGSVINDGQFRIYNGPDFNNEVTFNTGWYYNTSVSFWSTGLTLDISLPAGQYRVFAYIANNEGQGALINEVAYIYSNLTTDLDRVIGAADFITMTTISGTVQYKENGVDQNDYGLSVYTNPEGSGYELGSAWIYSPGAQSYTLRIPRQDENVTLYIFIRGNGAGFLADSISITAGQAAAAKNISATHSSLTLSGTVTITGVDGTLIYGSVSASPEEGGSSFSGSVSGGAWTISGIPADFSGTLNFDIQAGDGMGQWYSAENIGSWTSGSPTSGIPLNVSFITVTGSFTVTIDSAPIGGKYVNISAYRESVPGSSFYVYLAGSYDYTWTGNTCKWTFSTAALAPSAQVELNFYMESGPQISEIITLGSSNVPVPLKTYNYRTLRGTLGTVTVNGISSSEVDIYAKTTSDYNYYFDDGYYRDSENSGKWQIYIPSDFAGTLTIGVEPWYEGGRYQKDVTTRTISGSSLAGIALGDTAITLNPVGGTVTTNGTSPLNFGMVVVLSPPEGGVSDLYDLYGSTALGTLEITNGAFSGYYVDSGFTTGYVVIAVEDENYYYVTPSPVTLGSSMSFNLSAMTKAAIPDH